MPKLELGDLEAVRPREGWSISPSWWKLVDAGLGYCCTGSILCVDVQAGAAIDVSG